MISRRCDKHASGLIGAPIPTGCVNTKKCLCRLQADVDKRNVKLIFEKTTKTEPRKNTALRSKKERNKKYTLELAGEEQHIPVPRGLYTFCSSARTRSTHPSSFKVRSAEPGSGRGFGGWGTVAIHEADWGYNCTSKAGSWFSLPTCSRLRWINFLVTPSCPISL
jgi:hypothetical protein